MSQRGEDATFCPECGANVENMAYCPDCGESVSTTNRTDPDEPATRQSDENPPAPWNASFEDEYVSVRGRQFHQSEWLSIVGGVVLVLGAFLPWATTPFGSFSGLDFAVGQVTLAVGLFALTPVLNKSVESFTHLLMIGGFGIVGLGLVINHDLSADVSGLGHTITYLGLVALIVVPLLKYYHSNWSG